MKNTKKPLTSEEELDIIKIFKTSKLNSIKNISKEFNVKEHIVHKIINEYLSSKTK